MSRRRFLRAAGGSALLALAGCGGSEDAPAAGAGDVRRLDALLDVERRSAAAYTRVAQALDGERAKLARDFGRQDREHARRLAEAVLAAGGRPAARGEIEPARPRSPSAALRQAVRGEEAAIAAYLAALPTLADPRLRPVLAAIATARAQRLPALGAPATAFVTGRA